MRGSTVRNQAHNLTSVLIHGDKMYVHWIEGPHTALQSLWGRVSADPRHTMVTPLQREDLTAPRLYPGRPFVVHGPAGLAEITNVVRDLCVHAQPGIDGQLEATRVIDALLVVAKQVPAEV